MRSIEEQNIENMEGVKRSPVDVLSEEYGGKTRRDRRAFKSRLKRLVRKEARKKMREGARD